MNFILFSSGGPLFYRPTDPVFAVLDADAGSGQGVALIYKKDPDKFSIENPMPFYQHPAQAKGLEIIIPCEARVAGAILYYPLSLMIVPGMSKN